MESRSTDSHESARPTDRAAWLLVGISCCASLAAMALIPLSFALGTEALRANPTCASNTPAVAMAATLRIEWMAGAGCVVIAWLLAWLTRRAAITPGVSSVSRAGRAAHILAALALVGLILSFCYYTDGAFAACIG